MDGPREDSINWRESVKKKRQMSLWYHLHVGSKQNERDKRTLKRRWCCESSAPNMTAQIWKTQQWPQDWKRSVFNPIPKKGNAKECSNYHTIVLISHASKVMLRLQQYMNRELPDVQAEFRKGRGTRDQIANIHWIMEKAREFQKNIYFCFIDYAKASDWVDHNKLWTILKEMGIPDHLTCLLRNL